jgi:glycosyltransferase involved in cell wall biosynthesis
VYILLLNQFYPPDPAPTGQVLHDLARALVARGHEVRVRCSRGAYRGEANYPAAELRDGVAIERLPGGSPRSRLAGYAAFWLAAAIRALFSRRPPDLTLALSTPPFLGLVGGLRGRAHVHWVMDLYPDALVAHGLLRKGSLRLRTLERVARRQFAGAQGVLALGPFMARRLESYAEGAPVAWIPLWGKPGMDEGRNEMRHRRGWAASDLVLLYSGNMGLGHRFREFLDAARRLDARDTVWAFIGDGPRRAEIQAAVSNSSRARIELLPAVPEVDREASLASGDVHLASLAEPWQGVIVPSKIQAAFAAARPVLFVGGTQNEAAEWIRESGGGWVVGEDDVAGVLAAVEQARDPRERAQRGAAAHAFARQRFDPAQNLGRIVDWMEGAGRSRERAPLGNGS